MTTKPVSCKPALSTDSNMKHRAPFLIAYFAVGAFLVSSLTATPANAEIDTAALWTKNCASCHGADGKADTKVGKLLKVSDLTDPEIVANFDRDRMIEGTKAGIANAKGKKVMKPFASKLSDEEIEALTDFVFAFSGTVAAPVEGAADDAVPAVPAAE
ncbi:MAG: mono/diheme cytochrome c family protein [Hyphomicrobiaceae bacterium]|jgi:mono/diheme cytochrome c family protein